MSQDDLAALLNDMAPDDRTLFVSELPAYATRELLTLLSDRERATPERLLSYPVDSVGRLMTTDYVAIRAAWTIQQVLDHIRAHGRDSETLYVLYVIDDGGVLVDDVRMREFLLVRWRLRRCRGPGPAGRGARWCANGVRFVCGHRHRRAV